MSKSIYALQVPGIVGVQEVFFDSEDLALLYAKYRGINSSDVYEYPLYCDRNDFSKIDNDLND